ncbi:MAG: metallophosphoesterase [Neomegalonema sp.]|nr:metallophosphoesterase [Neomegalonema sp.]
MRLFAISDLHVDYSENARWIENLSTADYTQDLLILAGDISHVEERVAAGFHTLKHRFAEVFFVPGNHDLWIGGEEAPSSFDKFDRIAAIASDHGVSMRPYQTKGLEIIPLLSWYDGTFGAPSDELRMRWMDYRRCNWSGRSDAEVTDHFLSQNHPVLERSPAAPDNLVVSFSHFLPRIDVMPLPARGVRKLLGPVLGSARLDAQVNAVESQIHIYGHSHLNRHVRRDGRTYINNALGAPSETHICARELVCVVEL